MNKRKISYIVLLAAGISLAGSCKRSFVEVNPKGSNIDGNYYRNQTEAFTGLVAVYDIVG